MIWAYHTIVYQVNISSTVGHGKISTVGVTGNVYFWVTGKYLLMGQRKISATIGQGKISTSFGQWIISTTVPVLVRGLYLQEIASG